MKKSGKKQTFKDKQLKRMLYQGVHQIPVFNLKIQNEPIMHIFKFMVYRTSAKIYFEAQLWQ